jgi:hypothetical protein
MSRLVDLELINARNADLEQIVQDGKYIETMEGSDKTPESIKEAARKVLGLPEDGIILLEASNIMKKQNLRTKAYVSLTNFLDKSDAANMLTDDEKKAVEAIEARIAKEICETYDIDIEDLYVEGDK